MAHAGKRHETSYTILERITSLPYARMLSAQALYAARKEVVLTIRLLDGSLVEGLRIPAKLIFELEFIGITASSPNLAQVELWALSTPEAVRTAQYV